MMAVVSVRLSVCPVPDPKSRTERHRKLKFGRKEAHDIGDPWSNLEVERLKVRSPLTRLLNAVTENQPYLPKAYKLNLVYGWSTI